MYISRVRLFLTFSVCQTRVSQQIQRFARLEKVCLRAKRMLLHHFIRKLWSRKFLVEILWLQTKKTRKFYQADQHQNEQLKQPKKNSFTLRNPKDCWLGTMLINCDCSMDQCCNALRKSSKNHKLQFRLLAISDLTLTRERKYFAGSILFFHLWPPVLRISIRDPA